jgi:hypothetical protein
LYKHGICFSILSALSQSVYSFYQVEACCYYGWKTIITHDELLAELVVDNLSDVSDAIYCSFKSIINQSFNLISSKYGQYLMKKALP